MQLVFVKVVQHHDIQKCFIVQHARKFRLQGLIFKWEGVLGLLDYYCSVLAAIYAVFCHVVYKIVWMQSMIVPSVGDL